MFPFVKKSTQKDFFIAKLQAFQKLIENHPVQTENFIDSLTHFSKIFQAESASLFLYESKTGLFVLKKWTGTKPTRFSISVEYEFVDYLRVKGTAVHRDEFSEKTANEMRQPALYYYQQTLSNLVVPLISEGEWLGLLNIKVNLDSSEQQWLFESLCALYGDSLKKWMLYQRVNEQNKKLNELSHVKNQLLSNVTHELQTPLNGILGVSSALMEDPQLDRTYQDSLKLIYQSGKDLSKTVGNILELVQIEAKKDHKNREKINIIDLIQEVGLLYADACQKNGIKLIVPQSKNTFFVYAQPDQIRTVLMNLMSNAVKFTEEGQIKVDIKTSGEMLQVSVSDTGVGIDDDKMHLIFEEFYQGDGSHTRTYGGTGLGLAIVKKIVSLHGGRVWVDSERSSGSTFSFTIPLYPV